MSEPIAAVPPRVPFLDPRTGDISREWYLLILAIIKRIGGSNGLSAEDLALGTISNNGAADLEALLNTLTADVAQQPAQQPTRMQFSNGFDVSPSAYRVATEFDLSPRLQVGTIASQNADRVAITGGTIDQVKITRGTMDQTVITRGTMDQTVITRGSIDNTPIGATVAQSAKFTSMTSPIILSTAAPGVPPFIVNSATQVPNLNVSFLESQNWASPGAIGATARNSAEFTTLVVYGGATIIDFTQQGGLGFYGAGPTPQGAVTGSRGGNAALASLLSVLAGYGLINNSTTV